MLVNAIARDSKKMYEEELKKGEMKGKRLMAGRCLPEIWQFRPLPRSPGCRRWTSEKLHRGCRRLVCLHLYLHHNEEIIEHRAIFGDLRKTQLPINIRISYTSSSST